MKQQYPVNPLHRRKSWDFRNPRTWLVLGIVAVICGGMGIVFRQQLALGVQSVVGVFRIRENQLDLNQYLAARPNTAAMTGQSIAAISGPLRVSSANPRYFEDAAGKIVYLTGSHTWANFQDNGNGNPPPVFDYTKYLDFLAANNHNFFRLWTWEQSRWTLETSDENYWFYPEGPYVRSGPGNALDGKQKWDLTRFNQAYFDRMRQRVIAAGQRGMYVSIMLFDGWSVVSNQSPALNNPWKGHPYNSANNINSINGDPNGDSNGREVHSLAVPAVTRLQEAYIAKVIDTLNDLDNVLYEIANEAPNESIEWQYHLVDYIHDYETGKPKQHPVGMTGRFEWSLDDLLASGAEWVSPGGAGYMWDPPAADGRAVVIVDTDHLWGIGGDRVWVWKSFTRGLNPIFMDGYDGAAYGVGGQGFDFNNPVWVKLRAAMGHTLSYARRMNMASVTPRNSLCSTGYCLANLTGPNAELLVYQPSGGSFTVNLAGNSAVFNVEWFNPATGQATAGNPITGGTTLSFTAPFGGDAVLYLKQQGTATGTATSTPTATPLGATKTPVPTMTNTATPTNTPNATLSTTPTGTPNTPTITPTPTSTGTATPTSTVPPQSQFPTSPLLDNFNRPDGGVGYNWGNQPSDFRVSLRRLDPSNMGSAIWRSAEYGPDQEAYVTLTAIDLAGGPEQELGLVLKATRTGGAISSAARVTYSPTSKTLNVYLYSQPAGWQPAGAPIAVEYRPGDRLGAQAHRDGIVELFRNTVNVGSVQAGQALANRGGQIGVYVADAANSVLDNFGGGNITDAPPPPYTIQLDTAVAGQGRIEVLPTGTISCGQAVTVTAVPAAGWQFIGWTGDLMVPANPLHLKMSGSLVLIANFAPTSADQQYEVSTAIKGRGTVQIRPQGPYRHGQVVELAARPALGWRFDGWTGTLEGTANPLQFQITEDMVISARFVRAVNLFLPSIQDGSDAVAKTQESCQ
jgi:hypothetical protein